MHQSAHRCAPGCIFRPMPRGSRPEHRGGKLFSPRLRWDRTPSLASRGPALPQKWPLSHSQPPLRPGPRHPKSCPRTSRSRVVDCCAWPLQWRAARATDRRTRKHSPLTTRRDSILRGPAFAFAAVLFKASTRQRRGFCFCSQSFFPGTICRSISRMH